ncbi:hypothetical protein H4582DRAFT_1965008 [Lactarius indigo]|nr:hypothetical protein H4582DRAFT_1965008 [Lactarius indigo]
MNNVTFWRLPFPDSEERQERSHPRYCRCRRCWPVLVTGGASVGFNGAGGLGQRHFPISRPSCLIALYHCGVLLGSLGRVWLLAPALDATARQIRDTHHKRERQI